MAPTWRSSIPFVSGGSSPAQQTLPTNAVAGDLLLLFVIVAGNVIPTVSAEWHLLASEIGHTSGNCYLYQKTCSSSEPDFYYITWTGGGIGSSFITAVGGTSFVEAYLVQQQTTDIANTSKTFPAVNNTSANTLLMCIMGSGNAVSTPDGAMTERLDTGSTSCHIYLMTQSVAATGSTGTRTATGSSVNFARTFTVSVRESGSAIPPSTSEVDITEVPVFAELEGLSAVEVTSAPTLVEIGAFGIYSTSVPVIVEIGAPGIQVTSAPVLIEIEFQSPLLEDVVPVSRASNAGTRALHTILPTEVTGYAFDPEYSWWTIIVPEATENLIINPSFEKASTFGYDYDVATGWQSVAVLETNLPYGATRGHNCLKLVGNTLGQGEFVYVGDVDNGNPLHVTPGVYTFSLDIYATNPDSSFELEIRHASGGAIQARRRYERVGSGWKRYAISYAEAGSSNLELVFRDTGVSGLNYDVYYLDGWQFEAKPYATTYCDGDMVGFYDTRPQQSYYWKGVHHQSTSIRRATTGSGGREVSFSREFGLYTTGIIGLGMADPSLVTQSLGNGKELFLGSTDVPRDFTIVCRIFADGWRLLSQKRNVLINLIKPNNTPQREPLLLRYQPTDDKGKPYGIPLEIICAYSSGLGGNITNLYQESLPLQFHASDPILKETIEDCEAMPNELRLTPMGLVYRDADMEYQNLGNDDSISGDFLNVSVISFGYDDRVIIGIDCGGVPPLEYDGVNRNANVLEIRKDNSTDWDEFAQDTFYLLGSFEEMASDRETGIATIVVGTFFYDSGGDHWNNIAMMIEFDGATNGKGLITIDNIPNGLNDTATCVENHAQGVFYVGGEFTDEHGVVGTAYTGIIKVVTDDGLGTAVALPVKGGLSNAAYTIKSDGSRYVYIGGDFAGVYDDSSQSPLIEANNIVIYDTLEDVWIQMGAAGSIGVNGSVADIEIAADGSVYIIGHFEDYGDNNIPLAGIGKWNGYSWEQPFDLTSIRSNTMVVQDLHMKIAPDGIIWIYSRSTIHGFENVPGIGDCFMFGWRSGIFYAPPYEVEGGNQAVSDLKFLPNGEMIIAFRELGTHLRVPNLLRLNYPGNADCYPTLVLSASYPQFIINHSVDAGIFFEKGTELNLEEVMRLDLSTVRANIFSNLRTDMSSSIQLGATNLKSFRLTPGENRISMFNRQHIPTAQSWVVWRNAFWSIDAAVENELFG